MRFKIRFSLRFLFILLTVATVFFGVQYNRRVRLQDATKRIEELHAEAFYAWQEVKAVTYTEILRPYFSDHSKRTIAITANRLEWRNSEQPKFRVGAFLLGTNEDIAISAVSISAASVDENTLRLLQQLDGLEIVLLLVDERYLVVEADTSANVAKLRQSAMERFGKDFRRAKALIQAGLPNVSLHVRPVPVRPAPPATEWINPPTDKTPEPEKALDFAN